MLRSPKALHRLVQPALSLLFLAAAIANAPHAYADPPGGGAVTNVAVPEASTIALLGLVLPVLGYVALNRRRK